MKLNFSNIIVFIVSVVEALVLCQPSLVESKVFRLAHHRYHHKPLLVNKLVPNVTSSHNVPNAQRRSENKQNEDESQSLFKSLIPKSPFKKPIKKIFRSWFEPDPEALNDDSTSSTFYFTRSKLNIFQPQQNALSNNLNADSSTSHTSRVAPSSPKHSNFINRAQYLNSYANHEYATTNRALSRSQLPTQYAIGDPSNGRGMTISFGDNVQSSEPSYSQTNEQYSQDSSVGHRGLSLSFEGNHGGSGMSFNIGRGNGEGRGMSLSLGGGGGSGMSFSFGSGGGNSGRYKSSGSSSYPAYSSYGSNYGYSDNNNYGYSNNYDYYPQQPLFSMVMPSMGKTVVEMNQHPPKLKMKINSSPKVKITTNTKDPLEKPGLEDEVIMEDIFGPPAPFDKPIKNQTKFNETFPGMHNMTMAHFNQSMFPYPYPYPYPYPHYYQYPYNYYYNYYQHYPPHYYNYMMNGSMPIFATPPQQQQTSTQTKSQSQHHYPSYSQYSASTINGQISPASSSISYNPVSASNVYVMTPTEQHRNHQSSSSKTGYNTPMSQNQVQYSQIYTYSQPSSIQGWSPTSEQVTAYHQVAPMTIIDNNSLGYKRSSASRNYQKDMLTLSTNSIKKKSYLKRKPLYNTKRNWNKYYYDTMQTMESQTHPKYGMRLTNNFTTYPMSTSNSIYYQYPQIHGTGIGYSFYNTSSHYNGTYWNPYNYYYNPYYYYNNYNYYDYAKKYYDAYYGNHTSYYKKNRTSITGYSQNSFDYEQSKIFGSRKIQYPGGSTKEEKARIIFDVRPRVTLKMLNKTEQMMQDEELKKKKKDHIFKTHMEIIMESTTTSTAKPYYNYDNYYGYNYGPEEDEFGWTHEPPYSSTVSSTPKPKPITTTRRRTTTTEAPSSSEVSEEENGTSEATSSEISTEDEDRSTTTVESNDVESASEEVDDETSQEQISTTTTTMSSTTESIEGEGDGEEEVIEGNEDENNSPGAEEDTNEDQEKSIEEVKTDDEEKTPSDEENGTSAEENGEEEKPPVDDNSKINNITVAPELVAAMIRALQEALGVTTTTTPMSTSASKSFEENEEDKSNFNDKTEEKNQENDISKTTKTKTTSKPKMEGGRRRIQTNVVTTTVRNTTQLRLKTPVLSIQSRTTAPSNMVQQRVSRPFSQDITRKSNDQSRAGDQDQMVTNMVDVTTTSPFIIVTKSTKKHATNHEVTSVTNKVIDGDALLSNFDVNNLTDDERRDMLTNILGMIQNKLTIDSNTSSSTTSKNNKKFSTNRKKNGLNKSTRLLPVTKANNVRIISSLDELNKDSGSIANGEKSNQPIYIVLLPQNKKKK